MVVSRDSAITRFRGRAATQFTDTATVQRPVGESYFDTDTEQFTQDVITLHSDEPCKIRPASVRGEHEDEIGETSVGTPDSDSKWAVDLDIQRGDIVTVTASRHDGGMAGRVYTVKQVPADSSQVARVVTLEEFLPPLLNEVS